MRLAVVGWAGDSGVGRELIDAVRNLPVSCAFILDNPNKPTRKDLLVGTPSYFAQPANLDKQMELFIECHRLAPFKPRGVDVDVVLDLMIHDLDVILSLVKSPVKSVSAVGTPVLTKVVDIANARVEFESGTIANITASRVSQSATRKFRVFQQKQYLSIDFGTGEVNLTTKTGEWKDDSIPLEFDAWSLEKADALLAETKAFVNAVKTGGPVVVSGEDGLVAMRLAIQIQRDIYSRLEKFS